MTGELKEVPQWIIKLHLGYLETCKEEQCKEIIEIQICVSLTTITQIKEKVTGTGQVGMTIVTKTPLVTPENTMITTIRGIGEHSRAIREIIGDTIKEIVTKIEEEMIIAVGEIAICEEIIIENILEGIVIEIAIMITEWSGIQGTLQGLGQEMTMSDHQATMKEILISRLIYQALIEAEVALPLKKAQRQHKALMRE